MIKKSLLACLALLSLQVFALDDAGWLKVAQDNVLENSYFVTGETEEDGLYCLVVEKIKESGGDSAAAQIETSQLEAKRRMTAYMHGESMTAERTLESSSKTETKDGEKVRVTSKSFSKKVKTKVDALLRGCRMLGQITVEETSYVVVVATEEFEDHSIILQAAMEEMGEEGVVSSVGEASSRDEALQRALRGAIEQVLGTVVVGYSKTSSNESFKKKMFSGTDGFVDTYRVLEESDIDRGYRVKVVAKVSKKSLLDSYSNYMKLLGDPEFFIECSSPDLESHFAQFFNDLGIRITKKPEAATYIIRCHGEFRDVTHPANGRSGKQLSLRFRVHEMNDTEEVLLDMKNDPRKSACFVGRDPDRQSEICAEKAFKQMKKPLHENIQKMVAKLVGRKMDAEAAEE